MSSFLRHILSFLAALVLIQLTFVSCADEQVDDADEDLDVVASTRWECGRTMGVARAITNNPLGDVFPTDLYPDLLFVSLKGASDEVIDPFVIAKTTTGNDNTGFTAYHDQYKRNNVRVQVVDGLATLDADAIKEIRSLYSKGKMLSFSDIEANTLHPARYDGSNDVVSSFLPQPWADTDIPTFGAIDHLTTKPAFGGETRIEGKHLFLTLGHVSAMLRLHFAVSADYSKLRYIDLKSVTINGNELTKEDHLVLKTEATPIPPATKNYDQHQLFAFTYIKPYHDYKGNAITTIPSTPLGAEKTAWTSTISTTTPLTFKCTYDIYDKDAYNDAGHLTRRDVTATNQITLRNLFAKDSSPVTTIRAGHYYDLYITINPDYLYVLSEHDNKHLEIQ